MVTKAVIIGVSDVIRLCTARAVGAAGYSVDIIRVGKNNKKHLKASDFYCKYVENYFFFDENGGITLPDFLMEKYKGFISKPVLFTLGDRITHVVDAARDRLGNSFLFAHLRDGGSLSELMDKHFMKLQAEAAGLSVVKGWPVVFENDEFSIPDGIEYPCFVKGLYSYWNSKPIQRRCNTREDLAELTQLCKTVYPHSLYAEEYVDSKKETGILGVCNGVECVVPAKTELVLMGEGSNHGVSILGRVKPIGEKDEIKKNVEKLLKSLGYVGIFNIDFIEKGEKVYFVELNLRYATYGYCIFKAGVNIPALFIDVLKGQESFKPQHLIESDSVYLNEEVASANIIERKLSGKKYRDLKKQADIRFVQSEEDPRPMGHLRVRFVLYYLLMLKKRMTRKVKNHEN